MRRRTSASETATPLRCDAGLQAGTAQAALGFVLTSLGACIALLARDLHMPAERVAGLSATFGVGLVVVAAAGPSLLRRGPHLTLRGGALLTATGSALLAVAPTLLIAIGGALLLGIGGAAIVLVTPALLAGPDTAVRLTRVNAASSTAAVIAPAAIGAVEIIGANGRLALLATVAPLLMLATIRPAATEAQTSTTTARPALGQIARHWSSVVLAVAVEFCFTIWAVARLHDTGVSTATAALLGSSFPAGMAVGRLLGPPLLTRLPVIPVGGALVAASTLAIAATHHAAVVTGALTLAGIGVATLYPVTLATLVATPDLAPHHAASLGALASGVAILTAPAALAALSSNVGLRTAFLITIPLLVALLALHPQAPRAAEAPRFPGTPGRQQTIVS
ncbi:MFS transporter [Micromonospora inositola]|uniref:Cyanate permease n=1 Tax=Micromonospora inositola TaxID=47865 RepID=A0A1C5JS55_9ACTN|nr:MFS transporter [Micromonospora inositola]SCG73337.1 Cyanate permease [Micromonospora inositola]